MRYATTLAVIAIVVAVPAGAIAEQVHGRGFLQGVTSRGDRDSLATSLVGQNRNDVQANLRLAWTPRWGSWGVDFAYDLGVEAGDQPQLDLATRSLSITSDGPPRSAWDGSDTIFSERRFSAVQKIDRLAVGYSGPHLVIRAGRQALTLGSGFVFHTLDLFDPFSPDATDVEYKPGTDMLYAQYLFDDGSDMQFVAVPRPTTQGGSLTAAESSTAVMLRRRIGAVHASWLLARDRNDAVVGIGISGTLLGSAWNAEIVPTFQNDGARTVSALFNVSHAGSLKGRDLTYFFELYRNGFGVTDHRYALNDLSISLVERLQRGQVFSTGRDYVASGAELQVTPLFEIRPTVILNLNDRSALALLQADYSLGDNLTFVAGLQLPMGPHGTAFGGIGIDADAAPYLAQPARLYLQIRRYF